MEKDYTKILWKIEEVWKQHYTYNKTQLIDISNNYNNRFSKYNNEFRLVESFDFTPSHTAVHTDDYGSYKGLYSSQLIFHNKKPIYLFDNHNKIIFPFVELYNYFGHSLNIVHIDAHPDDAKFKGTKKKLIKKEEVKKYFGQTRISDFFDALSDTDIIQTMYPITHSDSFEFFIAPEKPYILSLDIDIFGPEGNFVELHDKVRAIALAWGRADAVCIATSPGFIDQKYAQKIISIFVK